MAEFTELYFEAEVEARAFNGVFANATARRAFIVPASTEGAAITHPSLPPANSVHPRLAGLYAQRAAATPTGDGESYTVIVPYGEVQYEQPPPDPQDEDPSYRDISIETSSKTIDIPVITARQVYAFGPTGVPIESREWAADRAKLHLSTQNLRAVTNITVGAFTASANAYIRSQINKIHEFDGDKWLFRGARVSRANIEVYQVEYSWEWEEGNPEIPEGETGPLITGPDGVVRAFVPARAAYQEYEVEWAQFAGPPLGGDLTYPVIKAVDRYDEELAGALALPGNPLGAIP